MSEGRVRTPREKAGRGRVAEPPEACSAQLATLVTEPPEGDEWLHEIKYDGYRILARLDRGTVRLLSRNGLDWTARFSGIAAALAELPVTNAWLDGEAVAFTPRGVSDFSALQAALKAADHNAVSYVAFDLLFLDGRDLRDEPLAERKRLLAEVLGGAEEPVRYSDHIAGSGQAFFAAACRRGLEGVVSKRAGSRYTGRRADAWRKSKCTRRQELVVGGYSEPQGSRHALGALLVGVHDGDGLRYAGRVGSGFNEAILRDLEARLLALRSDEAPFVDPPRGVAARGVHWVRPELVVEVAFSEWTPDGSLRHPVFKGLREDKPAAVVERERPSTAPAPAPASAPAPDRPRRRQPAARQPETAQVAGVTITHPQRLVYADAGLTKLDVAAYYQAVARRLLPHISGRPLTLVRCPNGVSEGCFMQKHPGAGALAAAVPRVRVREAHGFAEYPVVERLHDLIVLVQAGALELHTPGSHAPAVEEPDQMVFDFDPAPGLSWGRVCTAARLVRDELLRDGLRSFVKTSGGKGLHVVVPLTPSASHAEVAAYARRLAEGIVAGEPESYTATMSKAKREGKVFIDHLRNNSGTTAVAAYSLRARPGAPVSLPLLWDEIERAGGGAWPAPRVLRHLRTQKQDPWRGFSAARRGQGLPEVPSGS